jgi:Fe-Mn family superoxide dismutase
MWDPISSRLLTAQIHDHQGQALIGSIPLMVLDAWEHAYYLQYHNEKVKYFEAIWNVWNWADIAARFTEAQKSSLSLQFPTGAPVGKRPTSTHQPGRA